MGTNATIPAQIWNRLICPQCSGPVEPDHGAVFCQPCNTVFPALPEGGVDFRLQRARSFQSTLTVFPPSSRSFPAFERLTDDPPAGSTISLENLPARISSVLAVRFPAPAARQALMLDLGCGEMIHRDLCERQGYSYIGLDYAAPGSMFMGDAQSLPFKDATFEFILSIAVLHEIPHPALMLQEAFRVLKPGGMFIGTAAYLETDLKSHHHFTHMGLLVLLEQQGFLVDSIAPNHEWTVPRSLLGNGLFPNMPVLLARAMISPFVLFHRVWWRIGELLHPQATEKNRLLLNTGSFFFIVRKPD